MAHNNRHSDGLYLHPASPVPQSWEHDNNYDEEVLNKVVIYVKNKYLRNSDANSIKFYNVRSGALKHKNYYYYNIDRKVLMCIGMREFTRKASVMKVIARREFTLVVEDDFKPQSLWDVIQYMRNIPSLISSNLKMLDKMTRSLGNTEVRCLIADVLLFIMTLRDGYFNFTKIVCTIVSILTLSTRMSAVGSEWKKQSYDMNFADVMLALSALGISQSLIDVLRTYMMLTGKKITDCELLMSTITSFVEAIISLIDEAKVKQALQTSGVGRVVSEETVDMLLKPIRDIMESVLHHFILYGKMKKVTYMYTQYIQNGQVMFDPTYRQGVIDLYKSLIADASFTRYVESDAGQHVRVTWRAFVDNVVKFASTFESSSRDEPICIVFEGPAGSGKSTLMNHYVELLKRMNRSVYVHTVPPSELGKDFYDDYENQEIFVMDDIGQQGISQWRPIMNMVSPVRYPLECAAAHKKNTKFFNSKIVLCTANHFMNLHGFTKSDCIAEPEALFRRAHVIKCESQRGSGFNTTLTYWKYRHLDSKQWVNEYIYENAGLRNTAVSTDSLERAVGFVASVVDTLEKRKVQHANSYKLHDEAYDNIIASLEVYDDAPEFQQQGLSWTGYNDFNLEALKHTWDRLHHGRDIFQEWLMGCYEQLSSLATSYLQKLSAAVINPSLIVDSMRQHVGATNAGLMVLASAILGGIVYAVSSWLFGQNDLAMDEAANIPAIWEREKMKQTEAYQKFAKQSGGAEGIVPPHVGDLLKNTRIIVSRKTSEVTHAVVSGNKLLLPDHLDWDKSDVDIYQSMDHYTHKHVEKELARINLIKRFPTIDLAVYQFHESIPMYKKCTRLFKTNAENCANNDPRGYILVANTVIPVVKGLTVTVNEDSFNYQGKDNLVAVKPHSGYLTMLTAPGLCGIVLADHEGNVEAFHVAGSSTAGYMVKPDMITASAIRNIMLDVEGKFDLDVRIKDKFSGARLRYEKGDIQKRYPIVKTELVVSAFHDSFLTGTASKLMDHLRDSASAVESEVRFEYKGPPIIEHPIAKLEECAMKTFNTQGNITEGEERFIEQYLHTLCVDFNDLSDDEAAFGNGELSALNKDSSNGYGLLSDKREYINFEEKAFTSAGRKYLDDYLIDMSSDSPTLDNYLCVESFKDELRSEHKREKPRTFRVMPLGHIFYTKKLLGNLVSYVMKNMHDTGICIGFNPYKDFDKLVRKLLVSEVTSGIDFGKYDGSLIAPIMRIISEVLKKHYKGNHTKLLHNLLVTTYNSVVLVYDAVYATTHGLPSGSWVTLLMNCLFNKCLTALTIYRNGGDIGSVHRVVDYVCGDDKITGSSGKDKGIFNALTIANTASSLGMDCTQDDKTPIKAGHTPLARLSFLKRRPVYMPKYDRYMGALSKNTILNTIQWINKSKDYRESMGGKIWAMQIESFLHGHDFYQTYKNLVSAVDPSFNLFSDDMVESILFKDADYRMVMSLSNKDISWINALV